jgi:hypothetical protein
MNSNNFEECKKTKRCCQDEKWINGKPSGVVVLGGGPPSSPARPAAGIAAKKTTKYLIIFINRAIYKYKTYQKHPNT